jgi:hypothetical protein
MKNVREIIFYKDYFEDFFKSLNEKLQGKIDEVLFAITILERVPTKFLKHIEGIKGLFEIRVEFESNIFGFFVVSTKEIWSCYLTVFKRKAKKLLQVS